MTRALGFFERAAARTDALHPFNAVVAATLDAPLDAESVRRALEARIRAQPLAAMMPVRGRFVPSGVAAPEFLVHEGGEAVVATEIDALLADRPAARGAHPVRARLVREAGRAALILAAPHYLVDAVSLAALLFASLGEETDPDEESAVPCAIEDRFPDAWRGLAAAPGIARFAASQMALDARIRIERLGRGMRKPTRGGGPRHTLRQIDATTSERISAACRRHGCTLNGFLMALAARVFAREYLGSDTGRVGVMNFRDLRRRVTPQVPSGELGADFAMLRHEVVLSTASDWEIAAAASEVVAESGRRGDAFAANLLAPQMVSASLATGMRFADAAVSLPIVAWPKAPLVGHLVRFEGYVSPLPIAPPLSIVGAQSPAGLTLCFVYLDAGDNALSTARMADALTRRLAAASESGV
jgi:hypothetical protein